VDDEEEEEESFVIDSASVSDEILELPDVSKCLGARRSPFAREILSLSHT